HRRTRNRTAKHDAPGGACAAPDFYNGTATIRLCTLLSWAEPTVHPRRHHEGSSMRIRTVLATLAATAVAAVTIPMAAQAAPGNTVVFGDSLPANPTVGVWWAAQNGPIPGGCTDEMGCGSVFLFANAVGAVNFAPIADYTCSGSSC